LKERLRGDDVAVIYISLNDQTSLINWESLNPIDAICRRIAFAALPRTEETQDFKSFAEEVEVSSKAIVEWLGASPRILLIDELNKLEGMTDPGNVAMEGLATFLKKHFLTKKTAILRLFLSCGQLIISTVWVHGFEKQT